MNEYAPENEPDDPSGTPEDHSGTSQPFQPHTPFTPEDAAYAAIISECFGLERAGAGILRAALITAGHLMFMGLANSAQQPQQEPEP